MPEHDACTLVLGRVIEDIRERGVHARSHRVPLCRTIQFNAKDASVLFGNNLFHFDLLWSSHESHGLKKIGGIRYPLCRRRTTYGEHPVQGCNRAFEIRVHPVTGELRDVDHEKAVFLAEASEIGEARHGAVVVKYLANHARGFEASEASEIDGCLRLAPAL
jgi:hypothetical protein